MQKRLFTLVVMLTAIFASALAQVTTSGISGKVLSAGDDVIGATVTATHKPSGTVYRAVTNIDGRFSIQGMRVGGPYTVEVSYIGMETKKFENVSLTLGETEDLSCSLSNDSKELEEVVVTGQAGVDATKTGAAQSINARRISEIPTVSHSIADIARMNPQITTNGQSGAMSFAGTNNRYNAFQIDGAMNNDMFGLTANGSNGGQAGAQPVSMETVEQIQINVAPFDVRQSGFTGGAINAITKSGTNEFHGSAYLYGNNEKLVGRHYKLPGGKYADPYSDESESMFGFTLGGPILKNKLFFFANFERSYKSYPNEYGLGTPDSKVDADKATSILNAIKDLAQRQGINYNGQYDSSDSDTWEQQGWLQDRLEHQRLQQVYGALELCQRLHPQRQRRHLDAQHHRPPLSLQVQHQHGDGRVAVAPLARPEQRGPSELRRRARQAHLGSRLPLHHHQERGQRNGQHRQRV